jgi:hypothetical protein
LSRPVHSTPAHVFPVIIPPSSAGCGRTAQRRSLGDTWAVLPEEVLTATGCVRSRPVVWRNLSALMKKSPRPNLKVKRLALMLRGSMVTSSCSTLTHSTAPMPSGNSNVSGSLKGCVVYHPLLASHTNGGFKHSSITVHCSAALGCAFSVGLRLRATAYY